MINIMRSLTEIERAVDGLTRDEKRELHRYLEDALQLQPPERPADRAHSVLQIPAVHLGSILQLPTGDDDLLGEMLEGRK